MLMPERFGGGDYKYSFNGMEKDDEVKGSGNHLDFGARCYDSRLAKFMSLDPDAYKYPFMSPYCYAGNTPIQAIDANGEGPIVVVQSKVRSTELKAEIERYRSGKIEFAKLYTSVQEIMGQSFKSGFDLGWLDKKYEESGLSLNYTGGYLDDRNYDRNAQPLPYVAYKQYEIDDDILYLVLTEEQEDDTWKQVEYSIKAPYRTFTEPPVTNPNKTQAFFTERNVVKGAGFILNIIGDFNPVTATIKGVATLATGENFTGGKASNADKVLAGASVILLGASIYLGTSTNIGKVTNVVNNASTVISTDKTTCETVIDIKESLQSDE